MYKNNERKKLNLIRNINFNEYPKKNRQIGNQKLLHLSSDLNNFILLWRVILEESVR
jgi:hypothetical protein